MENDDVLKKLEELTKDAKHQQLQTLESIIQHQAGVRYLQPYLSDSEPIDAETFRRQVPLSCYDDYADHVNRMANGQLHHHQPVLSVDPLLCFFYSSGTSTMKPKLIPYFDSALSRAASYIAHRGSKAILHRLFPPRPPQNKILLFLYADDVTTTRGGFNAVAASTYPLLKMSKENWSQALSCISPPEVISGRNIEQQMYCHLLCALRNYDLIDGILAPYAIGLVSAFSLLESKWRQLCDDLENGFPSVQIITDSAMRASVIKVLDGSRPDLSKRIQSVFEENNWHGIVSKLWPNACYVKCVSTGSMKQYYSKLEWYAGQVAILGGDYFASECTVAINLDIKQPPETTRFVMLPTAAYFEFLPFDLNEGNIVGKETVDITGVEVGKTYEVVVTTYRGFYRYRLGDVVRVVGFHNSSPEIEFLMRAPKISHDIITEKDLMAAMESLQLLMKNAVEAAEIVEFTSFLDLELAPKQLKIFLEVEEGCGLSKEEKRQESVEAISSCSSIENALGGLYKVQRDRGEVGPLLVTIVKFGSFDKILQMAVANGAPASQYKPPKVIRNREIIGILEGSGVVTVCLDSLKKEGSE